MVFFFLFFFSSFFPVFFPFRTPHCAASTTPPSQTAFPVLQATMPKMLDFLTEIQAPVVAAKAAGGGRAAGSGPELILPGSSTFVKTPFNVNYAARSTMTSTSLLASFRALLFLAPPHPTRAVCSALRRARADRVLIGAWNPTL